jgi:hypothetical protein
MRNYQGNPLSTLKWNNFFGVWNFFNPRIIRPNGEGLNAWINKFRIITKAIKQIYIIKIEDYK